MAISEDSYKKLASHIISECNSKEIERIQKGDLSPVRIIILQELILTDYQGIFLDVIMEDMFTQKKKPILKAELDDLADFLLSDLSPYMLKYYVSKGLKK